MSIFDAMVGEVEERGQGEGVDERRRARFHSGLLSILLAASLFVELPSNFVLHSNIVLPKYANSLGMKDLLTIISEGEKENHDALDSRLVELLPSLVHFWNGFQVNKICCHS